MSYASFIPYQVDYTVQNTAKTLGFSKKRVTFKFGFASERALRQGDTGPACRGSEHELTFVWSLASGKRQLLLDSRDVHFSESGQNGWTADRVWEHSFSLKDKATHRMYKVQFISQPKDRDLSDQRPFDLRIGDMSYFQFNKIFYLGTPRMVAGQIQQHRGHHASGAESPMNAEERQQMAAAKLASLKDLEEQRARDAAAKRKLLEGKQEPPSKSLPMQRVEEALISFDDDPPPVPSQVAMQASSSGGAMPARYHASEITLDSTFGESNPDFGASNSSFFAAPSNRNLYGLPPTPAPETGYNSNPLYGANPYGAPSSYSASQTSYGSNPYGAPAPAAAATTTTDSNAYALTPYQGGQQQQQQQQPYVDATGRLSFQQSGMSSATSGTYGGSASYYPNLQSPSNQTYNSYGSAPSFAQPPPPMAQQQQPNPYGGLSYGTTASAATTAPNFAPPSYASSAASSQQYYPPSSSSQAQQPHAPNLYPPPAYSYGN